jgi:hypothetical protein
MKRKEKFESWFLVFCNVVLLFCACILRCTGDFARGVSCCTTVSVNFPISTGTPRARGPLTQAITAEFHLQPFFPR